MKYSMLIIAFFSFGATAQTLTEVTGDVRVKTAKNGVTGKVQNGQVLAPLDTVITATDGDATIKMPDKNEIEVYPKSRFQIEEYVSDPASNKKSALFVLDAGKVHAKVAAKYEGDAQKFQISTPVSVCGVRGTDFVMGYDEADKTSRVTTLEGEVHFGLPGPNHTILKAVPVRSGHRSTASAGKPPGQSEKVSKKNVERLLRKGPETSNKEHEPKTHKKRKG